MKKTDKTQIQQTHTLDHYSLEVPSSRKKNKAEFENCHRLEKTMETEPLKHWKILDNNKNISGSCSKGTKSPAKLVTHQS